MLDFRELLPPVGLAPSTRECAGCASPRTSASREGERGREGRREGGRGGDKNEKKECMCVREEVEIVRKK